MITAHIESFKNGLEELKPLLPLHYEELALDKDVAPLDPDFDRYFLLEDAGVLLYVTLRSKGVLIGYYIGMIERGLHYRSNLECKTDIFYIEQSKRGKGGARILFDATEKELKRRGVDRWFTGCKNHKDASQFFEKIGFKKIETYHSKLL